MERFFIRSDGVIISILIYTKAIISLESVQDRYEHRPSVNGSGAVDLEQVLKAFPIFWFHRSNRKIVARE